jgi:hypothetical protein
MKLDVLQRNALIAQYMPLARSLAAKKHSQVNWIDIDELRSAAYYGLVDAASRYDTEHGGFFRYAMVRISGEVQDYLRSLGFGSKGSNSRGCRLGKPESPNSFPAITRCSPHDIQPTGGVASPGHFSRTKNG